MAYDYLDYLDHSRSSWRTVISDHLDEQWSSWSSGKKRCIGLFLYRRMWAHDPPNCSKLIQRGASSLCDSSTNFCLLFHTWVTTCYCCCFWFLFLCQLISFREELAMKIGLTEARIQVNLKTCSKCWNQGSKRWLPHNSIFQIFNLSWSGVVSKSSSKVQKTSRIGVRTFKNCIVSTYT